VKAITDATKCFSNDEATNIFLKEYDTVLQNVTTGPIAYDKVDKHFLHLNLLVKLQQILDPSNVKNMKDAVNILAQAVGIFAEHVTGNDSEKCKVQEYGYAVLQYREYVEFFSEICKSRLPDVQNFVDIITLCNEKVKKNLKHKTHTMQLDEKNADPEYYIAAIKYVNTYNTLTCKTLETTAYKCLGDIAENEHDENKALNYYIQSLKSNHELESVYKQNLKDNHELAWLYNKVGDLFFNRKEYATAIKFYKIVINTYQLKLCFKEWLKQDIDKPKIMLRKAKYFESIGMFQLASNYYIQANGLSTNPSIKAYAWEKASLCKDKSHNEEKNFNDRSKECNFYSYEMANQKFFMKMEEKMKAAELKSEGENTKSKKFAL
jgi:tetratricopeptide (TPR) repeat protein